MISLDDCMLYAGWLNKRGYGSISSWDIVNKKVLVGMAHRVFYENYVGDIPVELELDHLCKSRSCINPDHLEPVTRRVNMQRQFKEPGKCKQGHSFENNEIWWTAKTGTRHRKCKGCDSARHKIRYQKSKEVKR